MKNFLVRCFITIKLIANKKKEPFLNFVHLFQYLSKGGYFPGVTKRDFTKQLKLEKTTDGYKILIFNNHQFYYPASYSDQLVKLNFSSILNEQGVDSNKNTPHRYLEEREIPEDAVIFDLGASEGFQSKMWSAVRSRKIIIFEPNEILVTCLKKTFEKEIKEGRVLIIPYGVSNETKTVVHYGDSFKLESLENLMKQYQLPAPNFIKVDIEGQEMNFLAGAHNILNNLKSRDVIQIAVYHHPDDYLTIPGFLKRYSGKGSMSDGFVCYNRNIPEIGSYKKLFHPLFRKCIYTFRFNGD